MGMFDNIDKAQASARGANYAKAGHYLARIDRVKAGESQQGAGEFVAVEMTVLAALPDGDVPLNDDFEPLGPDNWHRVGEQISHVMMTKHKSFLGNMKAFVSNVGGIPESEVGPAECQQVTEGLFDGVFIELRNRDIKTKTTCKRFTIVGYIREVPASEIGQRVDVDALEKVLGPGKIQTLIEAEEAE